MSEGKLRAAPHFESEAEEIEFWKTHDVDDYLTGETVTLEDALGPDDEAEGTEAVITVQFPRTLGDQHPLTVHYLAHLRASEAASDLSLVFKRDVIPRPFDGYALDYHNSILECGASGPQRRQLVAQIICDGIDDAQHAVQTLRTLIESRSGAASHPAEDAEARATQAAVRVAVWLVRHRAAELTPDQLTELFDLPS
ncbi:MAG TPA: hypothetical protein QGH10_11440 [Armatimonadota bacterium]|jgi:hypothetical protein|nr:hypothetical protein [Armatimonadota bacterium]